MYLIDAYTLHHVAYEILLYSNIIYANFSLFQIWNSFSMRKQLLQLL